MSKEVIKHMMDIYRKKNEDYSGGQGLENFKESLRIGIEPYKAVFLRLMDKYSRAQNLFSKRKRPQVDESLYDTMVDMANYAIFVICLIENSSYEEELANIEKFFMDQHDKEKELFELFFDLTVHYNLILHAPDKPREWVRQLKHLTALAIIIAAKLKEEEIQSFHEWLLKVPEDTCEESYK